MYSQYPKSSSHQSTLIFKDSLITVLFRNFSKFKLGGNQQMLSTATANSNAAVPS